MRRAQLQSGFSLIELVVVVVLLGLLAGGAGLLILQPIEAYGDQVRRQQLVDQGEMALRQIARDIRRALPNSVRVTPVGAGFAVEMVNTIDGARYRDEVGGEFTLSSDSLEFPAADTDFNLLGSFNILTTMAGFDASHRLVIYNTSAISIYDNAALDKNPGIVTTAGTALILSTNTPPNEDAEHHIRMNPAFRFAQQSPGQRIFVIDGPTSYICNPATNQILRYSNYAFSVVQPTPPGGIGEVVVSQLSDCSMTYDAGTSRRGGILTIEIEISDSGESITLLHQVHVVNVP